MAAGGALAVDTAELDEVAARLRRVVDEVDDAGHGLAGLRGVLGLAVGAQAVFDALADLSRQWEDRATSLGEDAAHLRLLVEQASALYRSCEGEVAGLLCLPGAGTGVG